MIRRLLLSLTLCGAASAQAADAARVEHYMDSTGLSQAINDAPAALVGGLVDSTANPVTPKEMEELARRHFDTKAMHRHVADRLAGEMTDAEMDTLAGFADSPFGQRMAVLEDAAHVERPGLDTMIAVTRPLFADPSRVLLTQRLDNASGLTDFAVATSIGAITGGLMYAGRIPSDPEGFRKAADAIDRQFRPTIHTQLQQQLMFSLLYTYRALSADELKQYVEFLEQPAPRHATALVLDCLRDDILKSIPPVVDALYNRAASPPGSR